MTTTKLDKRQVNTLDTGWQNVTFQNGYSAQNNTAVRYRKIGAVVYLAGQAGKATLDSNPIFTLPENCRPGQQVLATSNGTGNNVGKLVIGGNGVVNFATAPPSSAYGSVDCSFIVVVAQEDN